MKKRFSVVDIILNTSLIYSAFFTVMYTLGAFMDSAWIPSVRTVYSSLLFALMLSLLNMFLFSDKLVMPLRLLIHYGASTLAFMLLFAVFGDYKKNGGSVLSALLIYTFAYILIGAVVALVRYIFAEDKKKDEKYEKQFKEDDKSYTSQFGKK